MATKKVLTLKHRHGVVHELDCRWLEGLPDPDWRSRYEVVLADTVRHKPHCSYCSRRNLDRSRRAYP
jgi:hypothetical protein